MAHFVAKILHIRPNDILDDWGVPELLVAYGQYANEIADDNYRAWWSSQKGAPPPPQPRRYVVRFIGKKELEEP